MFSIFTCVMPRVTHSEPGLPMVSHKSISLSRDVEQNPRASDQCTRHLVASVDNVDSVSFLETRLSDR